MGAGSSVRVWYAAGGDCADQPVKLGVGQQDHQHLPAAPDTALAQLVSQPRAGELSSTRQCLRDARDGVLNRSLVEIHPISHWLTWSVWRRRHQTRARTSHYRRRGQPTHQPSST